MGALRIKMIEEMRLRDLAVRIRKAYVAAVPSPPSWLATSSGSAGATQPHLPGIPHETLPRSPVPKPVSRAPMSSSARLLHCHAARDPDQGSSTATKRALA